ncbi:MAG: heme lyase CcmF/NrfE family subunit [Anaerolineae bacterium]|nr:heme lyase CcmF/NrfE family subunit [Anaerolineae bacterium]
MLVTELGYWSLVIALATALYAAGAFFWGARRGRTRLVTSARISLMVNWGLVTLTVVALTLALVTRQFSVRYVYEHTSTSLPLLYTLSALWAGQEGSLLLWLWLLAGCAGLLMVQRGPWLTALRPYALAVLAVTQALFAAVLTFEANPFTRLPTSPSEGLGLNPLLQNVAMIIHPPVVFIGYAAFTVPFALAVAALLTGRLDGTWLRGARAWGLFAWGALGVGILLGAWWAYRELGWGGYWSWDPVENASLVPWLTGTAMLHSMVAEERRGTFRMWNVGLATATFLLCVFATFVTRSGIIHSVHAFTRSHVGYYFLGFIGAWLAVVVVLIVSVSRARHGVGTAQHEIKALLSREAGVLLSNLLLTGMALAVLLGTLFPAIAELVYGAQMALGEAYYGRAVGPLALMTVALLGVCPWLAWGTTRREKLGRRLVVPLVTALVTGMGLVVGGVYRLVALVAFSVGAFALISIVTTLGEGVIRAWRGSGDPARAAVGFLLKNRRRYGAYLVHLSVVIILAGITGSAVYREEKLVTLRQEEVITFGGYSLTYEGLQAETLPDKQLVRARLRAVEGGRQRAVLAPELNLHFSTEQQVSEVAVLSTLREDLYVALVGWEDYGRLASFLLLLNPLVMWLWIGGGVMVMGTVIALWPQSGSGAER